MTAQSHYELDFSFASECKANKKEKAKYNKTRSQPNEQKKILIFTALKMGDQIPCQFFHFHKMPNNLDFCSGSLAFFDGQMFVLALACVGVFCECIFFFRRVTVTKRKQLICLNSNVMVICFSMLLVMKQTQFN